MVLNHIIWKWLWIVFQNSSFWVIFKGSSILRFIIKFLKCSSESEQITMLLSHILVKGVNHIHIKLVKELWVIFYWNIVPKWLWIKYQKNIRIISYLNSPESHVIEPKVHRIILKWLWIILYCIPSVKWIYFPYKNRNNWTVLARSESGLSPQLWAWLMILQLQFDLNIYYYLI